MGTLRIPLRRSSDLFKVTLSLVCGLVLSSGLAADSADGGTLFTQKCSGCHTVGGGTLVGPDLKDVASRTDVAAAVKRMQSMAGPLSDDEQKSLVDYLKSAKPAGASSSSTTSGGPSATGSAATGTSTSAAAGQTAAPTQTAAPGQTAIPMQSEVATQTATPSQTAVLGSASRGRELFNGQIGFENGGVSCISCHQAENNGGSLGPDLSGLAAKMPAAGIQAACEATPFKVMKEAYAKHPITKQEAADLTAYFESLKSASKPARSVPVGLLASAGAALLMGCIAWGYRNRNTSVRAKLKRR